MPIDADTVARWKNYLIEGTRALRGLKDPPPDFATAAFYTVTAEMEEALVGQTGLPTKAHLVSAATCWARAGNKDRARRALRRAHDQRRVDVETLRWFKKHGVEI